MFDQAMAGALPIHRPRFLARSNWARDNVLQFGEETMSPAQLDPLIAAGVLVATAATDAVYVMFTAAVTARRRVPAASWSSVWYLLSSFAVISYTNNWIYVCFAALGSWLGAYASMTFLHRVPSHPPPPLAPMPD
jgi:hypothetical protein